MLANDDFKIAQKIDDQTINGPYRTILQRILAGIIDSSIFSLLFSVISLVLFYAVGKNGMAVMMIVRPIIFISYNVYMVKKYGGSIGKLSTGLKVLTFDHEDVNITWVQSIKREVINIFNSSIFIYQIFFFFTIYQTFSYTLYREIPKNYDFIGLLSIISVLVGYIEILSALLNKKRRALHDYLGNTVVKKVNPVNRKVILIGIVLFVISLWIYGRVMRLFL